MKCENVEELLLAHVHDELTSSDFRDVNEHLITCSRCRTTLAETREFDETMRGALKGCSFPEDRAEEFISSLTCIPEERPALPRAPLNIALLRLASAAAMVLLASALLLGIINSRAPEELGEVVSVRGAVLLEREAQGSPMWISATHGIRAGDVVQTSADATATLRLADESTVELKPGTLLRAEGPKREFRQVLYLDSGEIECSVNKGGGRFCVDTPGGRVTVLGTRFSVLVEPSPNSTTKVRVDEGSVSVANSAGEVMLTAGECALASSGVKPSILPARDLSDGGPVMMDRESSPIAPVIDTCTSLTRSTASSGCDVETQHRPAEAGSSSAAPASVELSGVVLRVAHSAADANLPEFALEPDDMTDMVLLEGEGIVEFVGERVRVTGVPTRSGSAGEEVLCLRVERIVRLSSFMDGVDRIGSDEK